MSVPDEKPESGRSVLVPAVALAYGALLYFALPPTPIVVNDDFGYLRSIVETVAHGRPWTNDWLEPWSASLSVLSVLLFKLTGSFHFATSGAQALFSAASVAGAAALLRARGLRTASSAALALVAVSFPTLLWKSLEFNGVALYLPCLLWAIWAAEKGRWGVFLFAWLMAMATRQSALVWIALPGWAFLTAIVTTRAARRTWLAPGCTLVGGALVFGALTKLMNKTHAQAGITDHLWDRLDPEPALMIAGVGAATILAFLGLGALAVGLQRPSVWPAAGRLPRTALVVATAATLAVVLSLNATVFVEHQSYHGLWGPYYAAFVVLLAVLGWVRFPFRVRWGLLLAAAGGLALLLVRRQVWDYYFMDAALFAFFSPIVTRAQPIVSASTQRRFAAAWWASCLLVVAFHVTCAIDLKAYFDRFYAASVLAEDALARGRIEPADLSFTAFGLIGWHLHPYFVANEGKGSSNIAGFLGYLRRDPVQFHFGPMFRDDEPAESRAIGSGNVVLGNDVFPVLWFWHRRVVLIRNPNPESDFAPMVIDPSRYEPVPFPLNDEDWRALLDDAARQSSAR